MAKRDLATLSKALIVTGEVMGHELSPLAAEVMARDLDHYAHDAIHRALERCRREVSGRLTLAAIEQHIVSADGRPGPEEAWATASRGADEALTLVWTDEMCEAFDSARELMIAGDNIAARMAFKESYARLVETARADRVPPHWTVSQGHDARGRLEPVRRAVELGRLPVSALSEVGGYEDSRALLLPPPDPDEPPEEPAPLPAAWLAELRALGRKGEA